MSTINDKKNLLVECVAKIPVVRAIGQTSNPKEELIPGFSDIDIFVLCDGIPGARERRAAYEQQSQVYTECNMNVCENCIWGTGDILKVDGVDTMFMFFTVEEMSSYVNEVLSGKHIYPEGEFYPFGRLATVANMYTLYDENDTMKRLKDSVSVYPDDLAEIAANSHICCTINEEDLGRCLVRKDVIFYHKVLEHGLDHFLQALYAVNRTYFPSRKRTMEYIKEFEKKPVNCYERILKVIENGAKSETIPESIKDYRNLCEELKAFM